jgi:ribosome-associated heat shock protein Hsp15
VLAGRVKLNGERTKPAHEVKAGDFISVVQQWDVEIKALSETRGPAESARKLYEETAAGRAERERRGDLRRWGTEPARALKGRPTKRDRRLLERLPLLDADAPDDGEP